MLTVPAVEVQRIQMERKSGTAQLTTAGQVRCDSREVTFRETWQIRCQAVEKKKRLLKRIQTQKREKEVDVDQLERDEV
jgi:argininosuccinate lyase